MGAVSADMVRQLREATGAGMMECKKALVECEGDMTRAADFLRVKSGVKAGKVSGRTASEGRLAFAAGSGGAVLAEVNCETDFVARGDDFAGFCRDVASALASGGGGELSAAQLPDGRSGEQARQELVMKVGENVTFGRVRTLSAGGSISHYVHTGDKIAAMIDYEGGDEETARDVCMHIAAMRPAYLDMDAVPSAELDKEREIFTAEAAESGKPPEIAAKMAEGKLKKHFAERALLLQPFVKDGGTTTESVLKSAGMSVRAFHWIAVGGDDA